MHFGKTLGDQVKCRSRTKLKSLIEVPHVVHVKVHVLSFNIILSHIRSVFLHRVIHFGENLGDKVKGRPPKKLKIILKVPYVCQVKVHVYCFNMILLSSP